VPRIVITFLISFFPIIIATVAGIVHTPEELLEMSRSLKAPRIREITQIRLPSAIPHIFSGLKVSITLSVIGAVVAEFVAAEKGLGYAILFSTSSFKVATAYANLAVLVLLSLVLFRTVSVVQRLFFDWSLAPSKET
jgi:NitT/TauT family transport system permease protein